MSHGNQFFYFFVDTLRGLDPSKKMRLVRTIHFRPFLAESSVMRQKTCFSVFENDIKKRVFVSENDIAPQEEMTPEEAAMPWNTPPPSVEIEHNIPQQIPFGPSVELHGDVADDGFEWIFWNANNQWYWRQPGTLQWTLFNE